MTRGRTDAVLAAALVVAGCLSPFAAAATDATGKWRFERAGAAPEFVDVAQIGSTLTLHYLGHDFTGTVSASGDYTVDAGPNLPPPCSAQIDGRVLPSGNTLDGRLLVAQGATCYDYPYIAEVVGTRCSCFDGNAIDGDGCSPECQLEPCFTCSGNPSVCIPSLPGASCEDGSVCTTGETCGAVACGGGSAVVPCVDMTGDWSVHFDAGGFGSADTQMAITQRGHDVVFHNASGAPGYVGTIDPATGEFHFRQVGQGFRCTFEPLDGTVASSGNTFTGTGYSTVSTATQCFSFPFTATGTRGHCGNGTLEGGEECDDGNQAAGDGCNASCRVEPCHACSGEPSVCTPTPGAPCDDRNPCTANDICNGASCGGIPVPDGTACDDEPNCTRGTCVAGACSPAGAFACPPCMGCEVGSGCVAAPRTCGQSTDRSKSVLSVSNLSDDGHDKLAWVWPRGEATTLAQLGNPLATDGYALCLYDLSGTRPALLFRGIAPAGGTCAGRSCWRAHGSGGFSYADSERTPDGIARIGLHAGPTGKARVSLTAIGPHLSGRPFGLPSPALPLPLLLQLGAEHAACFETFYSDTGVLRNDAASGRFRGRGN